MEVRSEPSFSIKMPTSLVLNQPSISSMRLTVTSDGTAVYKPITPIPTAATIPSSSSSPFHGENTATRDEGRLAAPPPTLHGMNPGGSGDPVKKKRGRPRKYSPDGKMAKVSRPERVPGVLSVSSDPMKKTREKSSSSLKKQQLLALGSSGTEFTPHVLTVKAGEDVSSKIMSFSQNGPRAICILSANGAISNVTLGQAATSGGTVTYEGRFEILSLSGSFMLSESDGQRSRTGGLSISLAGPDGRVIGGVIAGLLMAASPVQVVVGSFISDGKKDSKHMNVFDGTSSLAKHAPSGNNYGGGGVAIGGNSPPSLGTPSGSSGGPPSPFNQSAGAYNNSSQQAMYRNPWK